ncbi:MAG: helix-turn-helix transcriptional regulator [Polyangiales bacterium]
MRALRALCHFTREGLAMRAGLGGGARVVAAIERGALQPDRVTVDALAKALGVEPEALLAAEVDAE